MTIWFDLEKVTSTSFFETAPIRFAHNMHLDATADEVWAGLEADKHLAWCKALTRLLV